MQIPTNFWEEFDRILDEKLAPINTRLTHIEGWIKRQDYGIENELTMTIKTYLQDKYRGFITVEPTIFPKSISNTNGNDITEFDGILILTNDRTYANSLSKYLPQSTGTISVNTEAFLIIVEAKQHVTTDKITKKIQQKEKIQKLINDINANIIPMPKRLSKIGLQYITKVGLFIGGIIIDKSGREYMRKYSENDPLCGIIEPNGSRFSTNTAINDFGNINFGGKNKK